MWVTQIGPRANAMVRGLGAAALVVSLAGCGVGAASEASPAAAGPPPARVQVAQVEDRPVVTRWVISGEVRAAYRAELAAGAEGAVSELRVRVGDRVAAGDLLFAVDPSIVRAELRAAQASAASAGHELEQATRDAERVRGAGPNLVAESEIEQATSREALADRRRAQLAAEAARTRSRLARHQVRAPFEGQISELSVDRGDWVQNGQRALVLVSDAELEVLVGVDPLLLEYIDVGHTGRLRQGDREVEAVVRGAVRALDPETGTVRLRLVPAEVARWLLPGSWVDVELSTERRDGLWVPRDAVVLGVRGSRVMKVVDGVAQPVPVTITARGDDAVLVRGEGLAVGDALVTRGNERLRPGQSVTVVTDTEGADGP